ncbi:MAG: universal stress protein [Solirubrobacterales bacterium]|nr:universal stress protein [Solirubrobacterales bacterium]MBV9717252.1 universal stress protein [Solirubrobacterales bacterium]
MSTDLIVSYDGTPNDDDALALGQILARSGASLALAYVRHSREFDPRREEIAEHDAERRLEHGRTWLGDPTIPCHVVVSGSTGEGLLALADAEGAAVVVFGSDYRTTPGHADPGATAWRLLEGGPVPVAVAAAGLRTRPDTRIETIAVFDAGTAGDAERAAHLLADRLGAAVVDSAAGPADLTVVGSQPNAPAGRIAVGGLTRSRLNSVQGSVVVVPNGGELRL